MAWGETFGYWQLWAGAVLVASVVYALLKAAVPVGLEAKKTAAVGLLLTARTKDKDFARIGRQLAAKQWQKRKRILLVGSAVAGVLILSAVCCLVPEAVTYPVWTYALAAAAGIGIIVFSKY